MSEINTSFFNKNYLSEHIFYIIKYNNISFSYISDYKYQYIDLVS